MKRWVPNPEAKGLKGKIKYLEEKTYSAIENSGEIEKGEFRSGRFLSFNEDGNLLLEVSDSEDFSSKETYIYDSNGDLIEESSTITNQIYTYKYNSNNHIIEENCYKIIESLGENISFNMNIKGNLIHSKVYVFDSNRALIQEKFYNSDKCLAEHTIYKYDFDGKIKEENVYDSYRRLEERTIYKYDSNENMIEANSYDSDGHLFWQNIYNSNGILIEENSYENDGILSGQNIYDSEGHLIGNITYDSDGEIYEKYVYKQKYNSNRQLIYGFNEKDEELYLMTIHKYDSEGKEYRCITYESKEELLSDQKYIEFDDKNKWIKSTVKHNDRLEIIIRQIEYYEEDN